MRLSFPAFVLVVLVAAPPRGANGAEPQPTASLACPRVPEPGRVRCEIEVKPPPGGALQWADAVVVSVPPFVTPLRARVGPSQATTREDTVWHWTVALAARGRGSGGVEARVRVVICARGACTPSEIAVQGTVVVGDE